MNVTVDDLMAEIGRLHVQIMMQQKVIAELTAKLNASEKPNPSQV